MKHLLLVYLLILLNICACSDNNDTQEKKGHVWKEQTDAIEKAKAVEGILQDSADTRRDQIQDETQ